MHFPDTQAYPLDTVQSESDEQELHEALAEQLLELEHQYGVADEQVLHFDPFEQARQLLLPSLY